MTLDLDLYRREVRLSSNPLLRLSARVPAKTRADHLWELFFQPLDALVILEMALHPRQMSRGHKRCRDRASGNSTPVSPRPAPYPRPGTSGWARARRSPAQ